MEGMSSPTDVSSARARNLAVRDFGKLLRRAFDASRSYRGAHDLPRDAKLRVVKHLVEMVKNHGEIELELNGRSLNYQEQSIIESKTRMDSVALPLFREGVRRINFTSELTEEEAQAFLDGWIDAWLNPETADGVSSRLWESQPRGIRAVIIDTFDLGSVDTTDGGEDSRVATVREQIDAILSAISSESLAGSSDVKAAGVVNITADDAVLLRSEAVKTVTAAQLASQDVTAEGLSGLSEPEQQELALELQGVRETATLRFATALVNAALLAGDGERDQAVDAFSRLVLALGTEGQFDISFQIYKQLVADVQRDSSLSNLRIALLKRFRDVLVSAPVLDAMARGLDADLTAPSAEAAFRALGKAAVPLLTERLASFTTPAGKDRAMRVLTSFDARTTATIAQSKTADAGVVIEVLKTVHTLPQAERLSVLQRALNSPDVNVRRAAASALDSTLVVQLPSATVTNRLGDNDPTVRATMLRLALETENPVVVPAIAALLRRSIEAGERANLYEALSTMGGPKAIGMLVAELNGQTDTDLRVACAEALWKTRDPQARQALQETAAKLLTPPKLRAACKGALAKGHQ